MQFKMKKIMQIVLLGCAMSTGASLVYAEDSVANGYLQQIATNTNTTRQNVASGNSILQTAKSVLDEILVQVNTLPDVLYQLIQLVTIINAPDDSKPTADVQGSFTQLANLLMQDTANQLSMQGQLNKDLLGKEVTMQTVPYANDLLYSTLLGVPYFSPDPRNPPGKTPQTNPQYNYIKNAAGINLTHTVPLFGWRGTQTDVWNYQNYYNAVKAIESFGGYVLSHQYSDGNQFNTLQASLIKQASDPQNWFKEIASEKIGIVLRQILLYQSQSYILLSQLVQTQRQMVTAQVMTNTLLIMNNRQNENYAAARAQGVPPLP